MNLLNAPGQGMMQPSPLDYMKGGIFKHPDPSSDHLVHASWTSRQWTRFCCWCSSLSWSSCLTWPTRIHHLSRSSKHVLNAVSWTSSMPWTTGLKSFRTGFVMLISYPSICSDFCICNGSLWLPSTRPLWACSYFNIFLLSCSLYIIVKCSVSSELVWVIKIRKENLFSNWLMAVKQNQ
jgi:hypothetical protein